MSNDLNKIMHPRIIVINEFWLVPNDSGWVFRGFKDSLGFHDVLFLVGSWTRDEPLVVWGSFCVG